MAARTAVISGTATAVSGRVHHNQTQRYEQQAQEQAAQQQQAAPPPASATDEQTAKLQSLAELHAQGVLSDDEFAAAKAKVLGI